MYLFSVEIMYYNLDGRILISTKSTIVIYIYIFLCSVYQFDVSEWFPVHVGLRQGCVMSPRLFNVYMDGVVREVNVRVLGKGLQLLSTNGGRFEINQL